MNNCFKPPHSQTIEDYKYIDPLTKEAFSIPQLVSGVTEKLTSGFPVSPPFTIQRLAELVVNPTAYYPTDQPQKYLAALERVLSVSSGCDDFERLDTAKLIAESQAVARQEHGSGNHNENEDEEMEIEPSAVAQEGGTSEANSNGHVKSPSILAQVSSVVVMSPIPWASAAAIEQQANLEVPSAIEGDILGPLGPTAESALESQEPNLPADSQNENVSETKDISESALGNSEHIENATPDLQDQKKEVQEEYSATSVINEDQVKEPTTENTASGIAIALDSGDTQLVEVTGADGEKRRRLSVEVEGSSSPK